MQSFIVLTAQGTLCKLELACRECGALVYGPPLRSDCRVLAGPAAER
jgi:hypothetical protein